MKVLIYCILYQRRNKKNCEQVKQAKDIAKNLKEWKVVDVFLSVIFVVRYLFCDCLEKFSVSKKCL